MRNTLVAHFAGRWGGSAAALVEDLPVILGKPMLLVAGAIYPANAVLPKALT